MGRLRLSRRYITILTVYFITIFTKVTATEKFELLLSSFTNSLGTDKQGNCCGSVASEDQCSTHCQTSFRICLLQYMRNISPDVENTQACTFGEDITPILGNNSFDIPSVPSEDNNFVNPIEFPLNFAWPGTFTLIIQAFHVVTRPEPDQGSERQILIRVAFQQFLNVSEQWSHRNYTDGDRQLAFAYRVVCNDNFHGPSCLTYCKPKNNNLGHWTCDETGEKVCLDGWQGDYCEIAICSEGCAHGTCEEEPGTCTCQYGWTGALCDQCIPYDGCLHGTCNEPGECNCLSGWGSLLCNQDIFYCTNNKPCKNGATCENTRPPEFYRCFCTPGYTGVDCGERINCLCQNGGTCQSTSTQQGYVCVCPAGFTGPLCEVQPTCCSNGGTCRTTQDGYQCLCPAGYFGNRCENRDFCISTPCANGGSCVNTLSGFSCLCPNAFTGQDCSRNICATGTCLNGGSCVAEFDTLRCTCPINYTGARCETQIGECQLSAPCATGATCIDNELSGYVCICPIGFTGRNCTVQNACLTTTCLNGGTCATNLNNTLDFVCICTAGWIGNTCGIAERPVGVTEKLTTPKPPLPVTPSAVTTTDHTTSPGEGATRGDAVGDTKSPLLNSPNGLSDITQIAIYVSFGALIIILIIILIVVVYRRQNVDHHHHHAHSAREVEKTDSTPNNRHMYRDNFSQAEKVLPLLSISSKVCNKDSDSFSKSKCKDYSAKEPYHESLPVEKISTQECMSYAPQTRHSLPRVNDSEDCYYYYDEKASQLKRTESLHSTCQSAESTPRHNIKCSIVPISAVVEESHHKSVNRNSQCYSVHLHDERPTPARLQATEV